MAEIKNFVLSDDDEIPVPFAGVYSYWLDKRGEAWAPSMSNFHLDDLEAKILPWSVIVDIQPNPFELTYRFWGTKRTALIDKDMTGKRYRIYHPLICAKEISKNITRCMS